MNHHVGERDGNHNRNPANDVSVKTAQMNILLSPPPLLLLLAALVAPATSITTYRPDWNRLRGLARGRVETCGG